MTVPLQRNSLCSVCGRTLAEVVQRTSITTQLGSCAELLNASFPCLHDGIAVSMDPEYAYRGHDSAIDSCAGFRRNALYCR